MSKVEKRMMSVTLIFSEVSQAHADAIMHTIVTIAHASADLADCPVQITACPPTAPIEVQIQASRVIHPTRSPCKCTACERERTEECDAPDAFQVIGLDTDGAPESSVQSTPVPGINARTPRGPAS